MIREHTDPVALIRIGSRFAIASRLVSFSAWDYAPLRNKIVANLNILLQTTFEFPHGTTLTELFSHRDRLEMFVVKDRGYPILNQFASPDPYTDDRKIIVTYDDIALIMLAI